MTEEGHGGHWQCIFEDLSEFVRLLPTVVEHGRFIDKPPGSPLEVGASAGIIWPETPLCALALISGVPARAGVQQELRSAFPYAIRGARHRLLIEDVIPWRESMAEAWVTASLSNGDGPLLTFFETRFYADKWHLSLRTEQEFILAGIAHSAEVVSPQPIFITELEAIRAMRAGTAHEGDSSPIEVHMDGAALLFPRDDLGPEDYEFQGPVKEVEVFEAFGRKITRLTLTVVRLLDADEADSDIDVELFVSDHAWRSEQRPKPGVDVRGLMWLQGRLAP